MDHTTDAQLEADRALIASLGGPTRLAEALGYEKVGGAQRVSNWTVRGIPAAVKVQRPDLFMVDVLAAARDTNTTTQEAA
jgi:hypothetical protein